MRTEKPPELIRKILLRMFPADEVEEIEGDMAEDFQYNRLQYGNFRARLYYFLDVMRLFPLYLRLRKRKNSKNTTMKRLSLYPLKYALRALSRQKLYQALNVATLTLGFSCFMLIFLFVYNQRHKDNFLSNPEQIVRLGQITNTGEKSRIHTAMPALLQEGLPEIEHFTRVSQQPVEIKAQGASDSFQESLIRADPGFTKVFQMELVLGKKPELSLNQAMVSETLARKLFGSESAIGKTITVKGSRNATDHVISGVLKDLPINSSFSNHLVLPARQNEKHTLTSRVWSNQICYFKVAEGTDLEALAGRIPDFLSSHTDIEPLLKNPYLFRTLTEVKYDPSIGDLFVSSTDGQVVFIFSVVGLVVLFLAIANYINLLSALSLRRTQEMSVKKVMGASMRTLIMQQITESFIICAVAMLCSSIILGYLVPELETYLDVSLKIAPSTMAMVIGLMVTIPVVITLLGALYPAVLMSGTRFSDLLKGKMSHSKGSKLVRNGLLTIQFTISTFLIIGTLTFTRQIGFIKSLHKSDEIGDVLILNGKLGQTPQVIKQRLLSLPEIDKVSISSMVPGPDDNQHIGLATNDFTRQFDLWMIDKEFLDLMGLEIKEGNDFFRDDRNNIAHALVNEAMIGIAKEYPLNKTYQSYAGNNQVIGIIKDFPIESAKIAVEPSMFVQIEAIADKPMYSNLLNKVSVRLKSTDFESAIDRIEASWKEVYPDQPFDIEFMDDRLNRVYSAELRMGQLFGTFTGVAIFISCLGIFGLLTFLIQVKLKELGIRKVLGAGFISQLKTLTINIWQVLIISNIIAFPVSYYFLQDWLNSFAYRTDITTGLFLATFLIFTLIISLTAVWQVVKVNRLNPTEVLRTE
jgi:putative ABC transport system permease protein